MSNQETIVTGDVSALTHSGVREFVFCSGHADFIKPECTDRRFWPVAAGVPCDNDTSALRESVRSENYPSLVKTSTIVSLIAASRAADRDIEQLGILSAVTVDMIRDALAEADAS
jgi:hypothetical protein